MNSGSRRPEVLRRPGPRGGALFLGSVLLLLITGCQQEPPEPRILRPVRTLSVTSSGAGRVRTYSGSAQAGLESKLSFRVAGSIQSIHAQVGDLVETGTILAELDPSDFQLKVDDAKASLARARAEQRNAEADLDRMRGLYENNNASQNELDASRTTYESAMASVASALKKLELAENQLRYTRLRSPVRGAVADVPVEVNENVAAGQPIILMASGSRAEVQVAIPEAVISRMRRGQPVEVRFDAIPDQRFEGLVTEVGIASVGLATTYPVTVRLSEVSKEIRPGMAAEVSFRFEEPEGQARIFVPPQAVGEDREGRFVFLVEGIQEGRGKVTRRSVQVGELTNAGMEIVSGLTEGDRLIVAGMSRIEAGLEVKILAGEGEPTP